VSFSSSICRTSFADDLVFEIHALSKYALKCLREKALLVVRNYHNAEFHPNISGPSPGVSII
jgi:hypothetical protein